MPRSKEWHEGLLIGKKRAGTLAENPYLPALRAWRDWRLGFGAGRNELWWS